MALIVVIATDIVVDDPLSAARVHPEGPLIPEPQKVRVQQFRASLGVQSFDKVL
jgi:hypothetical protein